MRNIQRNEHTSRDRPKSAPYPRLKNSKKTSKCQVFSFTVLENRNFFEKNFSKNYILKKWTERRAKISQCRKTERGDPLRFFNIQSVAKHQKKCGGPFGGKFFRKSLAVPKKNERGDPLVSPGKVCYAEKQEKPFWFSSLGQIVQFGAIIFCRTFKNYFGQFVWIEKKESL